MVVLPEVCFVVEDSEVGIVAAHAAGMTPIHFREKGMPSLSDCSFCDYDALPDMIEANRTT